MKIIKLIFTALFGKSKYKKQKRHFDKLREDDIIVEYKNYK